MMTTMNSSQVKTINLSELLADSKMMTDTQDVVLFYSNQPELYLDGSYFVLESNSGANSPIAAIAKWLGVADRLYSLTPLVFQLHQITIHVLNSTATEGEKLIYKIFQNNCDKIRSKQLKELLNEEEYKLLCDTLVKKFEEKEQNAYTIAYHPKFKWHVAHKKVSGYWGSTIKEALFYIVKEDRFNLEHCDYIIGFHPTEVHQIPDYQNCVRAVPDRDKETYIIKIDIPENEIRLKLKIK